jgi:cyclase
VSINSGALENPGLITEAASTFGSQCIVVSIDAKRHSDGHYEVYGGAGLKPAGRNPVDWAKEAVRLGAGELLLTSVERDGTMSGYDLALCASVCEAVNVPVIISGGAGTYEHMAQAILQGRASAVAAASMFHFTQQTPLEAKLYLRTQGIHTRN